MKLVPKEQSTTNSNVDWRSRAYTQYVSSGQADTVQDVELRFAPRKPYIVSVIKQHIPQDHNQVIIDFGCGSGAYLYFLREQGYRFVRGVDVSLEQVELAHKIGLLDVECNTLENYVAALPDSSVDIILLIDVLEHMSRQEIFSLLDEVMRCLKPGGKCLLHVPNAEGLFGMRVRYGDITHEVVFTPQSIAQILSLVGFENVQCFEDRPLLHSGRSIVRRIIWDITTLIPRLMLIAETGHTHFVLSQNMLVSTIKQEAHLMTDIAQPNE